MLPRHLRRFLTSWFVAGMGCPGFRWLGMSRARSTGIAMKTVLRGWKSGVFRVFSGAKYRNCTVFGTSSRDNQDLSALSSSSRIMGWGWDCLGVETGGFAA